MQNKVYISGSLPNITLDNSHYQLYRQGYALKKKKFGPQWRRVFAAFPLDMVTYQQNVKHYIFFTREDYGGSCESCHKVTEIPRCEGCNSEISMLGSEELIGGEIQLICVQCKREIFSHWKCTCGADNELGTSSFVTRLTAKMCFIATATCGNPSAPEVICLQLFRDEVLEASILGRAFCDLYYRMSPPFAQVIAKSELLRIVVRFSVISPLSSLARTHLRRMGQHRNVPTVRRSL
jgi:hypothetical protein